MKVFQIGFNKCATRSLFRLFITAGYKSVHWADGRLARNIKASFAAGAKPLTPWPDTVFFSDMELVNDLSGPLIEGNRYFAYLHQHYPDARFILNTRECEDWLFSRVDHNDGKYLNNYRHHFGLTRTRDIMDRWRKDWDDQHAAVRSYFANHPGTLLEYHIKTDPVEKLHDFFAPQINLTGGDWAQHGRTGGSASVASAVALSSVVSDAQRSAA